MRCKNCDYRLWYLKERRCPECGTGFKPSDYEFVPNSVRFCCPHCGQDYYGTDPDGLIQPREFDCAQCGRHIHLDEMVLYPTEGVEEEQTRIGQVPWLERSERGFFHGWWGTIKLALVEPGRMMELLPVESGLGTALWFAMMTVMIGLTFGMGICLVGQMALMSSMIRGGGAVGFGFAAAGMLIVIPVMNLVGLFVASLLAHGFLWVTGQTFAGYRRTLQAFCYGSGPMAICIVPCLGLYVGPIWALVSTVLTVRSAQRVHGGRAAVAVVAPPVLLCVGFVGLQVFALTNSSTFRRKTAIRPATIETQVICQALQAYRLDHQGRWPEHPLMLVSESYVNACDFVISVSSTSCEDVSLGSVSLKEFGAMSPVEQKKLLNDFLATQPDKVVAWRVGDYVFPYPGVDPDSSAGSCLWSVIAHPDPESNMGFQWMVAKGRGVLDTSTLMSTQDCSTQNALRQKQGLAPIPALVMIGTTKPAVREDGTISETPLPPQEEPVAPEKPKPVSRPAA